MTKRYYYTCAVKALYMMKEFEVKLVIYLMPEKQVAHEFDLLPLNITELLKFPQDVENRIYVTSESEHIFEPKDGDSNEDFYFDSHKWVAKEDRNEWYQDAKWAIAIEKRGDKHFFMPEIETDEN